MVKCDECGEHLEFGVDTIEQLKERAKREFGWVFASDGYKYDYCHACQVLNKISRKAKNDRLDEMAKDAYETMHDL